MAVETELKALSRSDLGPLAVEGQEFPIFATLDGVAVAVLPLADYRALLTASIRRPDLPARPVAKAPGRRPEGLSTIEKDPDVAKFIAGQFRGGVTTAAVRAACVERFGEERTPSQTRIATYRVRLKRA